MFTEALQQAKQYAMYNCHQEKRQTEGLVMGRKTKKEEKGPIEVVSGYLLALRIQF